ncbi:hypothetical protein K2173_013913 [Erythroxylum novogranatense]|uniref:Exonuclease domain-containing protein n=1 Tax=Erythroxylum novogranatense TaxID=1862640 RepID=A0AAV8SCT8_9ROSI|nr:hypothetical protein K2173_013913 [Erythroxylum novogranatense]
MDILSNTFSLLALDADEAAPTVASSSSSSSSSSSYSSGLTTTGKSEKRVSGSIQVAKSDNQNVDDVVKSMEEYKMPLVWIDMEMTGLNIEVDRILEIACIITDGNMTKSVEGPDIVIHQTKECLDQMGEWCQTHHAASGLTKKALQSTVSEREAEKQVIRFVKSHIGTYTPLLAGNSVYMDFLFLKKYMPDLAGMFSHIVVDVSSVKALCIRWFPRDHRKAPTKENKHRAMDDIRESIRELKYYKENIFKLRSKK